MQGAGGTQGGTGRFFMGLFMMVVGGYLFFNNIQVSLGVGLGYQYFSAWGIGITSGMVLVPFVLLKVATTGWRMIQYCAGPGPYRDRGAPPLLLRLLGPVVVLLTLLVFASGIALLLVPHSVRDMVLFVHKASFVLWFGAMTIHVLGHVLETSRLAPADLVARTRRQVRGAGVRLWAQAGCLVVGVLLAVLTVPTVGPWLAGGGVGSGG